MQDPGTGPSLKGRYTNIVYDDGSAARNIEFAEIESLGNLGYRAFAVQTGSRNYSIRVKLVQNVETGSSLSGQAIVANPFVVTPVTINSQVPFSAPSLAFGDVDGDGAQDLVIANGSNDAPLVTVVSGRRLLASTGTPIDLSNLNPTTDIIAQFYAFNDPANGPTFRGGLSVAVGDFAKIGRDQIAIGAGVGGGPRVQVWALRANSANVSPYDRMDVVRDFFAFEETQRGGVNVAAGDINGDKVKDLVVGAGSGGSPRVVVYSGGNPAAVIQNFFAYESTLRGGVLVSAGEVPEQRPRPDRDRAGDRRGTPHPRVRVRRRPPGDGAGGLLRPQGSTTPRRKGLLSVDPAAVSGVGAVAFGAPGDDGRQEILVSTAGGTAVKVRRYVFELNARVPTATGLDEQGRDAFDVYDRGTRLGSDIGGIPIVDPLTGATLVPTGLFDGAKVATFAVPTQS